MHFSLVKMNPPDAQPSHGFDDAILPLYYGLLSLGYEVEILFNRVNERSRNIVFGSCIAPRRIGRGLPKGSIIFNLEQINHGSKWCNHDYMTHLHDFIVWDYSQANIRGLEAAGINGAVHVPLGYVAQMTRLADDCPRDVDVLFYGLITDRRDVIIRKLVGHGVHVLATQQAFGALRDSLLGRTRAVLNVHQFLPARLEIVRLGYVWANRRAVISEWRADTEIPEHLRDTCVFAEYDDLIETTGRVLADPDAVRRQATAGFAAFASKSMAEGLLPLVGRRSTAVTAFPGEQREWLIQDDWR